MSANLKWQKSDFIPLPVPLQKWNYPENNENNNIFREINACFRTYFVNLILNNMWFWILITRRSLVQIQPPQPESVVNALVYDTIFLPWWLILRFWPQFDPKTITIEKISRRAETLLPDFYTVTITINSPGFKIISLHGVGRGG